MIALRKKYGKNGEGGARLQRGSGETGSEIKAPAQSIAVRGRSGLMGRTLEKITGDLNEGCGE
jgi:hypothetical protein